MQSKRSKLKSRRCTAEVLETRNLMTVWVDIDFTTFKTELNALAIVPGRPDFPKFDDANVAIIKDRILSNLDKIYNGFDIKFNKPLPDGVTAYDELVKLKLVSADFGEGPFPIDGSEIDRPDGVDNGNQMATLSKVNVALITRLLAKPMDGVEDGSRNIRTAWLVSNLIAHEVGHSMGLQHDDAFLDPVGFLPERYHMANGELAFDSAEAVAFWSKREATISLFSNVRLKFADKVGDGTPTAAEDSRLGIGGQTLTLQPVQSDSEEFLKTYGARLKGTEITPGVGFMQYYNLSPSDASGALPIKKGDIIALNAVGVNDRNLHLRGKRVDLRMSLYRRGESGVHTLIKDSTRGDFTYKGEPYTEGPDPAFMVEISEEGEYFVVVEHEATAGFPAVGEYDLYAAVYKFVPKMKLTGFRQTGGEWNGAEWVTPGSWQVGYEVAHSGGTSFNIDFYTSVDGIIKGQLLGTETIDGANLNDGVHHVPIDYAPGQNSQFLIAVIDSVDDAEQDSTATSQGIYFDTDDGKLYVYGSSMNDTVQIFETDSHTKLQVNLTLDDTNGFDQHFLSTVFDNSPAASHPISSMAVLNLKRN